MSPVLREEQQKNKRNIERKQTQKLSERKNKEVKKCKKKKKPHKTPHIYKIEGKTKRKLIKKKTAS